MMRIPALDRRDFLKLATVGVVTAGGASAFGCASAPDVEPGLDLFTRGGESANRVHTFSAHLRICEGKTQRVCEAIRARAVFAHPYPGIHYARIELRRDQWGVPVPDELMIGVIYDRSFETGVNFLVENGRAFEPVLQLCEGYPAGATCEPAKLGAYLKSVEVDNKLFFTAYDTSNTAIEESLAVHANFLALLRDAELRPPAELPYLVDRFLVANSLAKGAAQESRPARPPGCFPFRPQLTNTLSMVVPLKSGPVKRSELLKHTHTTVEKLIKRFGPLTTYHELFKWILTEGEWAVGTLHTHPLAAIETVHFARVALVHGKMIFASVYDGDFEQYARDFGTRVGDMVDLIWQLTEDYPRLGCEKDPLGFLAWLRKGQQSVDVQDFYMAGRDVTLLRMQAAVALRTKLEKSATALSPEPAALRAWLSEFVCANQALLG